LRVEHLDEESVPLAATADGDVRRLFWFVDSAFVGVAAPNVTVPWQPKRSGHFIVRAVDDRGRADSRELRVTLAQ
jgi:penicillin-binding protein 1C